MDPFTLAATAAAGTIQAVSQGNQNKKNRQFAVEQYQKQRDDAVQFWNMQNQYNSPQAQMQRFKEAGLSPHLAYSQGSAGNAAAIDTPSQAQWQGVSPGENIPGNLDMYFNLEQKSAQTDNLKAQNELLGKESYLKDIKALSELNQLDIDYSTKEAMIRQVWSDLRKSKTLETTAQHESKEALYRADQAKIAWNRDKKLFESGRWLASIKNVELRNRLMQEHIQMRKNGYEPGDKVWIKLIGGILHQFGYSLSDLNF